MLTDETKGDPMTKVSRTAASLLLAGGVCAFGFASGSGIDDISWTRVAGPQDGGWVPLGAARCDRDGDGVAELVVAYGGGGDGRLVWFEVVREELGPPEEGIRLGLEPAALAAGDVDGDGAPELVVTAARSAELVVVEVGETAADGELRKLLLPGLASRLEVTDIAPRDAVADIVVVLVPSLGPQRAARVGLDGRVVDLGLADPEADETGSELLLETRIDRDPVPERIAAAADGSLLVGRSTMAVIEVDTTADGIDFGGAQQVGDLPGPDGVTSLREAITAANNTAGIHQIAFNIPEAGNDFHDGAWWISPSDGNLGPLPDVTASATIDGYTQTSNRGDTNPEGPELVVDGSGLAAGDGLVLSGANAGVIDAAVQHMPGSGVRLVGAVDPVVAGCFLGATVAGDAAAGNGIGIEVVGGTTGAVLGGAGTHGTTLLVADRVVVSGNLGDGVVISGVGTSGARLLASLVGVGVDGVTAVGNGVRGVAVSDGADGAGVGGPGTGEGNTISGNGGAGVEVTGTSTTGVLVVGNRVGTDVSGTAAVPNAVGIVVSGGADTTIGGASATASNVVSGNASYGIEVWSADVVGASILGNLVGVDEAGATALANGVDGIIVHDGASSVMVGGGGADDGNLVSGNGGHGVSVHGATDVDVFGNLIGTDVAGTSPLGNSGDGVRVAGSAANVDVGGAGSGEGNMVVANGAAGVAVRGSGVSGVRVRGNLVGTSPGGAAGLGNAGPGVEVADGAAGVQVGGDQAGDGNRICAHPVGVSIDGAGSDGTVVQGNILGVAPGDLVLGNGVGVAISGGAAGSLVGGPGAGNEITHCAGAGVVVTGAGVGHTLSGNSIHDNGGLGIDLDDDGVTANDPGDGDSGPNDLVNFPVIASAVANRGTGTTTVAGSVDTASPEQGVVELFASSQPDPSGYGEGELFLGAVVPAADGSFTATVAGQPAESVTTAAFTDGAGSTSELGPAIPIELDELIVCPSGCAYATIQSAIDVAFDGETVTVHPGTYVESVDYLGKSITIRSLGGPDVTVIDGDGRFVAVTIGPDSTLEGFTVTGGQSAGVQGVWISGPVLRDCTIAGNDGYGVGFLWSSGETLERVRILDNQGGGFLTCCSGSRLISGAVISGNGGTGIGLYEDYGANPTIDIVDSTIRSNDGPGIFAESASNGSSVTVNVRHSRIEDNGDGGIRGVGAAGTIVVENSTISGNVGNGVRTFATWYSHLTVTESVVSGNSDRGIWGEGTEVVNTTVSGNGLFGIECGYPSCVIRNSTIVGNNPGWPYSTGSAITGDPTVVNSIVWGNGGTSPIGSGSDVTYSDVEGGYPGEGNIDAPPLFLDPRPAAAAPTTDGDYHVHWLSPCRDIGTGQGAPDVDIDGDPRPLFGGYDMGSDEVAGRLLFADGFESGDTRAWSGAPAVSWWPADGTAEDVLGGNDGVLVGGTGFTSGVSGQAFLLDGIDDSVSVPHDPSLNLGTGDLSIVLWVRTTQASGVASLADKRSTETGFHAYLADGRPGLQLMTAGDFGNFTAPQSLADDAFHHVAITIDRDSPTGGRIYVDGNPVLTFDPTPQMGTLDTTGELRFGRRSDPHGGDGYLAAAIDEIRIYGRALSEQEIGGFSGGRGD